MADNIQNVIVRLRAEGADQTGAQVERMAQKTTTALQKNSSEARKAAYEMSQVNMQLTDIVVSLSSGQQPLTVFLQQGGQLKDMFGGVGGAARALANGIGGLITPLTLVGAGVAAMVGTYFAVIERQKEFDRALAVSGNYAGITAGQFNELNSTLDGLTKSAEGSARVVTLEFLQTGRIGGEAMATLGEAALNWSRASGRSADDVAKHLAGMAGNVADWAAKQNQQMHFAKGAQIDYIRQLEESGQAQQAMIEVGRLVNEHFAGVVVNIGYAEAAWKGITNAVSRYKEAILSVVRDSTPEDMLKGLNRDLADVQRRLAGMSKDWDGVAITQAKSEEARLQRRIRDFEIEKRDAQVRKANDSYAKRQDEEQTKRRESLKKLTDDLSGANSAYAKSIKQVQDSFAAGDIDEAKRIEMLTQIATKYGSAAKSGAGRAAKPEQDSIWKIFDRATGDYMKERERAMEKEREQLQRRNDQAADYAQQLTDQTAAINIGLITDDRQRGEAQIELDRQIMQARIDVWAAGGADVSAAQEALNANILARQRGLNEQLKPEWQRMLDDWADTSRQMQKTYDELMGNLLKTSEDTFAKLASGQKVNFADIGKQIIADQARAQFRQMVGKDGGKALNGLAELLGMPTVKGYSGNEADVNFMGPLLEGADEVRMANAKSAASTNELTAIVSRLSSEFEGFSSLVQRVAQAMATLGASASGGSAGGWLSALGNLFGGGSQTPGDAFSVPTDVPGMTLAVGTNRLPSDGWRYLHEGEAVIPKAFNPWAGGMAPAGMGGGGGVNINSTVVVQSGAQANRAELQAYLDQRDAQLQAKVTDQLRRTGSAAYRAARA